MWEVLGRGGRTLDVRMDGFMLLEELSGEGLMKLRRTRTGKPGGVQEVLEREGPPEGEILEGENTHTKWKDSGINRAARKGMLDS